MTTTNQSLLDKLSLRSEKTRIGATVIIFAIVGGCVMLLQSLAATPSDQFLLGNGLLMKSKSASTLAEPELNNQQVLRLDKGGEALVNHGAISKASSFQFCVEATSAPTLSLQLPNKQYQTLTLVQQNDPITTSYRSWCSTGATNEATTTDYLGPAKLTNTQGTPLRVYRVTLRNL